MDFVNETIAINYFSYSILVKIFVYFNYSDVLLNVGVLKC